MTSTSPQWSDGAIEMPREVSGRRVAPGPHSTNQLVTLLAAEPEPCRASVDSACSESGHPAVAEKATVSGAKAEADEAMSAPEGKLFSTRPGRTG